MGRSQHEALACSLTTDSIYCFIAFAALILLVERALPSFGDSCFYAF